jgi:hypothetical protein
MKLVLFHVWVTFLAGLACWTQAYKGQLRGSSQNGYQKVYYSPCPSLLKNGHIIINVLNKELLVSKQAVLHPALIQSRVGRE